MVLKDEIRKLAGIQEIDSLIYGLNRQKETVIPEALENLKKAFEEKKKTFGAAEAKAKELQVKKKNKELDLATKEEGIKKAQAQLYQLKTNKEYSAKLKEIASLKADKSLFEEDILKIMDEIEATDKIAKEAKGNLAQEEKKFNEEVAKLNAKMADAAAEIKQLSDKKSILAGEIDKIVLAKYEKLLISRSGRAAAVVENENCSACHMKVTAQIINEIQMYKDLVFCPSCLRILFMPEDWK